ncbi:ABC transporter substrate-binding protein [Cohnella silvisoli]|uniref:ABC transporter substrate-binding protein n=1 Tax=Cohnella silvisoli TaxID=2873699 RepID=A0ABV1KNI8_9BACL|nr:ABC transporter substrate-binding protein [Cohnella silvisoli]MCD9020652.1 ABC transporter substrate-binding protein [Cohnella silvisoli]
MNKTAKVWGLVLTVCLTLALVLAGCGTSNKEKGAVTPNASATASSSPSGTAAASEKPKLDPVELSWYVPGTPQKDTESVEAEINKYLQDKINATIKIKYIDWSSFEQKLNAMTATGENFDLVFTAAWFNNYVTNAGKGAFLPMDELIDQYGPHLKEKFGKYLPAAAINGKLYALPYNIGAMALQRGINVNKQLADKYGFDPKGIKKLSDFDPLYSQIVKNEKGITPIGMDNNQRSFIAMYTMPFMFIDNKLPGVVKADDDSLTIMNQYTSTEFKSYVELMRSWNQQGFINKDSVSLKDSNTPLKAGKFAGIVDNVAPGWDVSFKNNYGFDIYQVATTEPELSTAGVFASMTAISKTSKNPERAMMLLDLVNSDYHLLNLFAFGIEGKHYMVTDGSSDIKIIKRPDGVTAETNGYDLNGSGWLFADPWMLYDYSPDRVAQVEAQKKFVDSAKLSPILGFVFNPEPVKTQVASVTAVFDQFMPSLGSGSLDVNKALGEFIDKMNKAGAEDIIKEMQKQIDAWKAAKK